jgi:hypothetical protein
VPPEPDFRLNLFDGEGAHHAENNQGVEIQPNDVLLLCTDGLTDLLWNDEILEVVRTKSNLKEASRALVNLANERGGHDNTTVVLIGAPAGFQTRKRLPGRRRRAGSVGGRRLVGLIVIGAVASILTFNLLRRGGGVTVTPAVSGPLPALVTETPSPEPTRPSSPPTPPPRTWSCPPPASRPGRRIR